MNRRPQKPLREFPVEQSEWAKHTRQEPPFGEEEPRERTPDLMTRLSGVSETDSPLERSLGPSCFFSLIIVFLMLVAFRRLLQLPFPMLALLVFIIWALVLLILVRSKPLRFPDD